MDKIKSEIVGRTSQQKLGRLTVYEAVKLTAAQKERLAAWLRKKADEIEAPNGWVGNFEALLYDDQK